VRTAGKMDSFRVLLRCFAQRRTTSRHVVLWSADRGGTLARVRALNRSRGIMLGR
jgi:hypothetical protein